MSREGREAEPQEEPEPRRRMAERFTRAVGREGREGERPRPRREVVTSPRTTAARHPRYPATREIDEQTRLGEVYMRSLVRTQFRLALFVCTVLGCVAGGLPLLFMLVPELGSAHLLGVPVPWALLAGLVYPGFVAGAWLYVRQAERNERHFAELVDRPGGRDERCSTGPVDRPGGRDPDAGADPAAGPVAEPGSDRAGGR
ncbi:hypothetical protein [Streptosporangium sandarakinum]|uniref:Uncharacterized protein n=1 Tax=Streptosporangium sandarakinum TaxID=1260955 RepID=A0A852V918_9ACTN|nr:hypothetical protein [Streptosporangium sandarakinum]NYF43753.1 hypothetical protein [Streptosporangium sandarakinum]